MIQKLFFLALIIFFEINAKASKVYASDFGWNANDATNAFQSAINSNADTAIVDLQASDWVVGPNKFFDLSDKTIIFEPGVVLKAKARAFTNNGDCLINFVRANRIKILGYGATFQMNKAEYAELNDGEWRHNLAINSSNNIEVYGLKLVGSGGDGVYISGDPWYGEQLYSENIVVKDLWCDNQYRQGISVISAQHLVVMNCWFTNTSGTLPMSGVDLEPDNELHRMLDVVFKRCRFTGNSGNGIQISLQNLTNMSLPVDITFIECYSSANHDTSNPYYSAEISLGAAARDAVTGNARFERCLVENSKWTAVHIRKPADSYLATFDDCVFLNVSIEKPNIYNTPVWIEVTDYSNSCPRFGGAVFNDCLLSYNSELNFLGSYGEIKTSPGMGNVQFNNLTVIHPNPSVTYNATAGGGSPDASCVFDFNKYTSAPATTINFTAQNRIIECYDKNSILESIRSSDNSIFPVAISYLVDGTAVHGEDFSRMNGFMIIPSNLVSQKDTIFILQDEKDERGKTISAALYESSLFKSESMPQIIFVWDCVTGITDNPFENKITVFPNPVYDFVKIQFADYFSGTIQLINDNGQVISSIKGRDKVNTINTKGLARGMYFIKIQIDDKNYIHKIVKL